MNDGECDYGRGGGGGGGGWGGVGGGGGGGGEIATVIFDGRRLRKSLTWRMLGSRRGLRANPAWKDG